MTINSEEFERLLKAVDELPEDEDLEEEDLEEEEEEEDDTDIYDLEYELEKYEYYRNVLADEVSYWRRRGH